MRVKRQIECPECGYPASEAYFWLSPIPGWANYTAIPGDGSLQSIRDPGHTNLEDEALTRAEEKRVTS